MSIPPRNHTGGIKPPARLSKAERKRQLLAHAKRLFGALGYQNTTMTAIAQAAEVKEERLLRHFESKKAIWLAILEQIRNFTLTHWQAETTELTDPHAQLQAVADLFLAATRDHIAEFRILHRTLLETDEEEIIASLRSFYVECETFLATIISEGQQTGVFRRSLDARIGAWELIRTSIGYTMMLPIGIPLYEEPDHTARAVECLLHCLLKTDV